MFQFSLLVFSALFVSSCEGVSNTRQRSLSNDELSSNVIDLNRRFTVLEELYIQQQRELESVKAVNENLRKRMSQMNSRPAFSVYADKFMELEEGDKMNFTGVITNIGNYYDVTQSHFNCPVAGTYYFGMNMQSLTNGYMVRAELVKNDVMLANAEVYDTATYEHMSSNSVIVSCAQGERVWVRAGARSEVHGDSEEPYTTFMGYLIEID